MTNKMIDRIKDKQDSNISIQVELFELLNEYKGILKDSMIDYLNSLIGLEFSVIREYISESDRKRLGELEAYKIIAIFNIYNRALKLFEKSGIDYDVRNYDYTGLKVSTSISDNDVSLFGFNYIERQNDNIPSDYRSMKIGEISLYQTLENEQAKNVEYQRIENKVRELEDVLKRINPYGNLSVYYKAKEDLEDYNQKLARLLAKKEASNIYKQEIETTNYIRDLFLEDYGIEKEELEDKTVYNDYKKFTEPKVVVPSATVSGIHLPPVLSFPRERDLTQITLTKKMPNLRIHNHITYR